MPSVTVSHIAGVLDKPARSSEDHRMRKNIILSAAGLTLALIGAAVASDHSGGRRHSERSDHSRSHDERAEPGARQGNRRHHDERREQKSREHDHNGDRDHDRSKSQSDRRS